MSVTDDVLREGGVKRSKQESIATRILTIARKAMVTPFRDGHHIPYASRDSEVVSLDGGGIRSLLGRLFYEAEARAPGRQALDDAVDVLRSEALYGGRVEPVYLRVAPLPDGIAIDLGTPDWTAVVVKAGSWSVEPHPVRFRRPPTLGPLPLPVAGGTLAPLRRLLNLSSDDDFRLVVGFELGALGPTGPYAELGLSGQQGSAKSFTARLLKRVVDPTTDGNGLRTLPKNEAAFWTAASNSWLLAFDNLSGITAEQSDLLSQLATGGGRTDRRLYTDGDEFVQSACRPVIMNGIELGDRTDLSSRTIRIELPAISEDGGYTVETRLLAEFDREHPQLLGALLDALAGVVAGVDALPETGWRVRMADHVRWVTAAERKLGWDDRSYEALFAKTQDAEMASAAEAVVWLPHLGAVIAAKGGSYEATASEVLADLLAHADATTKDFGWPKTGLGMAHALTRHAPALRSQGIRHRVVPDAHTKASRHHFDARGDAGFAGVAGVAAPSVSDWGEEEEIADHEAHLRRRTTPATPASPAGFWFDDDLRLTFTPAPDDPWLDHPPCPPALYPTHIRAIYRDPDGPGWICPAGCQYPPPTTTVGLRN